MSTFRTPVGPQPSKVYWRRRLLVVLGLAAVIIIVILIVIRPGNDTPVPAATDSTTPPPVTAETDPPADSGATVACDPTRVTLEPTTDAVSYEAGINPVLSFSLKSTMTSPCTISAGSDLQEFVITSGADRIWSSRDCQTAPEAATATLLPGVPLAGSLVTWDRARSATDTCETERPQVDAGGATYNLEVNLGDVTSMAAKSFLLY